MFLTLNTLLKQLSLLLMENRFSLYCFKAHLIIGVLLNYFKNKGKDDLQVKVKELILQL